MTQRTIDQMLEDEIALTKEFMLEGKAHDFGEFCCYLEDGKRVVIRTPFEPSAGVLGKQLAAAFVKTTLKKMNAWGYTFATEAWISIHDVDAQQGMTPEEIKKWALKRPSPSQDPNRIEMLFISAETRAEQRQAFFKMIRDPKGKLIDLEPFDPSRGGEGPSRLEGRFTGLLSGTLN